LSKQKKLKSKEWGSNIIRKKIGEWNYKTNYILKSISNKTNSNKECGLKLTIEKIEGGWHWKIILIL
jgi:hypothetical protein